MFTSVLLLSTFGKFSTDYSHALDITPAYFNLKCTRLTSLKS